MTNEQLEHLVVELSLQVGALEERIEHLEEKCSLGAGLSLTCSTSTGEPFYAKLNAGGIAPDGGSY